MASKFKATPLFDAHKAFVRLPMGMAMLDGYPDSKQFIETLCVNHSRCASGSFAYSGIP